MRLNYVYLKDLSKDLSKPIRMMLGEIVQNKGKVFTPVSHLIQQIYDQSAEFEQKNEKLDFLSKCMRQLYLKCGLDSTRGIEVRQGQFVMRLIAKIILISEISTKIT